MEIYQNQVKPACTKVRGSDHENNMAAEKGILDLESEKDAKWKVGVKFLFLD